MRTVLALLCVPCLFAQTGPRLSWSRILTGGGIDAVQAVAVASDGTLWVAGSSSSAYDAAGLNAPYQAQPKGRTDVFVARYRLAAEGPATLLYFTWLGGAGDEEVTAMRLDGPGRVYIAGRTTSADFPQAGNAQQTASGGNGDAFLTIIDPAFDGSGSLLYSGYHGGANADAATAMHVSPEGIVTLVGYSASPSLPGVEGSVQSLNRGGWDAFVVRVNPFIAASRVYSAFFGGGSTDVATGVTVDENGVIWFSGYSASDDFPVTPGAYRVALGPIFDGFLAAIDPRRAGLDAHLYGTFLGGSGADVPTSLQRDAGGAFWISGYTNSADLPVTGGAIQSQIGGSVDSFAMRLDPRRPADQTLTWASYLGGRGDDVLYASAVTPDGRLVFSGYTASPDFPLTGGASRPESRARSIDAFIAVVNPALAGRAALEYSTAIGGDLSDASTALAADAAGNVYFGGLTNSADFPVTDGVRLPAAFFDGFVARLSAR